jgi:hypothetical protein
MANARIVLFGKDPFAFVQLSDANLRHQTEYELRSKLIQLRRMYIPASVSVEKLCELMSDSLASFAALFRAVLLLYGEEAPVGKPDAVRATALRFGLDFEPFEKIFAFRATDYLPPSEKEANEIFASYLTQIQRVIETVDEFDRSNSGDLK